MLQKMDTERPIHRPASFFTPAGLAFTYNKLIIKRWVDAHTNLPFGARWFAFKQMWLPSGSNQAGSVNPPHHWRVFCCLKLLLPHP